MEFQVLIFAIYLLFFFLLIFSLRYLLRLTLKRLLVIIAEAAHVEFWSFGDAFDFTHLGRRHRSCLKGKLFFI